MLTSCKRDKPESKSTVKQDIIINKVIFFIDNSGSMYGYVNQANDFKNTVVSLAYMPVFDNASKSFYFINGTSNSNQKSKIQTNYIGDDPAILKNKLNQPSFKIYGNNGFSDLNKMFEIALDSAKENKISAIISDCIYDIGEEINPLTTLKIETQKTQEVFRKRLNKENIETIIIKAYSKFDGRYCFASKNGSIQIQNKIRPYYILFFGKTELLNNYLTDANLAEEIEGKHEIARFLTIDKNSVPYQAIYTPLNKGSFKNDHETNNKLIHAESNKHSKEFQFSIAVNFNSLPFSNSYLTTISNYNVNLNYSVLNVEVANKKINEVTNFKPTHIITVFTNKNPCGNLEIILKNEIPNWIIETNIDNENQIDNTHTFGFGLLTDAISKAYTYKNTGKNITSLKIDISN